MTDGTAAPSLNRPSHSAPSASTRAPSPFPAAAHVLCALWIALMIVLGTVAPARYEALLQEDRFIEWWTVTLFATAGFYALQRAWRHRRPFDALVGAFCAFVAGEEFSWGQRLLGITPPDAFLEHNFQQELTLHNFADVFGQPKWVLVLALAGFGVLLPLVARSASGRRLLDRIGATAARTAAAPWFLAAVVLLAWYPLSYTGEWVEALAGGLFLATLAPRPRSAGAIAAAGAAVALALSAWSGRGTASASELACAATEARALADDLAYGRAATGQLAAAASVHKRVFTAAQEGYIDAAALNQFHAASCPADASAAQRREHAIDPWGTAWWLSLERGADSIALRVYSFGPNRRRDGGSAVSAGDDVGASIVITP